MSGFTRAAPSSIEYSLCTCRCTKPSFSDTEWAPFTDESRVPRVRLYRSREGRSWAGRSATRPHLCTTLDRRHACNDLSGFGQHPPDQRVHGTQQTCHVTIPSVVHVSSSIMTNTELRLTIARRHAAKELAHVCVAPGACVVNVGVAHPFEHGVPLCANRPKFPELATHLGRACSHGQRKHLRPHRRCGCRHRSRLHDSSSLSRFHSPLADVACNESRCLRVKHPGTVSGAIPDTTEHIRNIRTTDCDRDVARRTGCAVERSRLCLPHVLGKPWG